MASYNFPPPGKQVYVAAFLSRVRQTGLHDAVRNAARQLAPDRLRSEMTKYAPGTGLQAIQGSGVRDEEVFAVPSLLRQAPGTLAYYRLLLGVSQKQFYTTKSGLNIFKPMEERQEITPAADPEIDDLCTELNAALSVLMHALPQASLRQDVEQLPLLTLGSLQVTALGLHLNSQLARHQRIDIALPSGGGPLGPHLIERRPGLR